ncbi:uncharacterized protein J4E84_000607 [Alternaria hordeiaustralica]|uniref:uncharacterized protein n=1 Tax=Alternaria hordeiaustralica TaxID=1187925 RepID=UPI0020C3D0B1|nr:uncharacterized protein J4E84_000607 [Alternaria hordeiaustralica]KAI4697477.1 hypothetical protein J4E84_000607 [Alternaria hordeiaustralica]
MACTKIPASVIMPPRELKQYKRWQCLHTNTRPAEQGYIPTAREYEDFHQWLKRQDSGYFSDPFDDISGHITHGRSSETSSSFESPVASICQHPMHPVAAGQLQSRCPVCIIDLHIRYMNVLSEALESAGGCAPSCTLTSSEHQHTVYSAWCKGKIGTLKELSRLELMAEEEASWSAQHPEVAHEDVRTAAKAVELYWSETTGCLEKRPRSNKQAAVVFAPDTDFEPGRPNPYFHRRSPRYEPGKHTVVEEGEQEDDVSEDSEDYSHGKIHHVGSTDESSNITSRSEAEESQAVLDSTCEIEEDGGDSDWEDDDSDEDNSDCESEFSDSDCAYFEIEEEASFIVFGDD